MHDRRARRPKIARLLAHPDAAGIRRELKLARSLGVGPSLLRGRLRSTTYLFDDPEHPDRVTGALESPAFTVEDRALLMGLDLYESTLCPGQCGQPIAVAWHSDMDGWWETDDVVCLACTALADGDREATYSQLRNERPDTGDLPPFVFGETTKSPST